MYYCHQRHIIHRDLKPDNILFFNEEKTKIKIIDFGVAGITQGEINKAGSISYMAPEIVGGWNYESNPKIDIFSLGCILYEMVTGEKLFKGANFEEKKDKILRGKLILSNTISVEIANLINIMIAYKSEERATIEDCKNHSWTLSKNFNEEELKNHELLKMNFSKKENDKSNNQLYNSLSNFNISGKIVSPTIKIFSLNKEKVNNEKSKEISNLNKLLNKKSCKDKDNSENSLSNNSSFENKIKLKQFENKFTASNINIFSNKKKNSFLNAENDTTDREFDFNSYLRSSKRPNVKSVKLGKTSLVTKVTKSKDVNVYKINYDILKSNGKILNYLQPIGFTKEQKQQSDRIKELLTKNFDNSKSLQPTQKNDLLNQEKKDEETVLNSTVRKKSVIIKKNSNMELKNSNLNKLNFNRMNGLSSKSLKQIDQQEENKKNKSFLEKENETNKFDKKNIIFPSTHNSSKVIEKNKKDSPLNSRKLPELNKSNLNKNFDISNSKISKLSESLTKMQLKYKISKI